MLTEQEARARARSFLAETIQPGVNTPLVLTTVAGYDHCWVVGYNSRDFVESGRIRDALAGGGPIIVNRHTGVVRQGVSGRPIEEQLDEE